MKDYKTVIENFLNSIREKYEELQEHPQITVEEFFINPPASREELEAEAENLPTILKEFYSQANGLLLNWQSDDALVKGSIIFPRLENLHNTLWKPYGSLDYSDYLHVVFQKSTNDDVKVLYETFEDEDAEGLLDFGGDLHFIEEYLEAVVKTAGHRCWQESYSKERDYSIDAILENRAYMYA